MSDIIIILPFPPIEKDSKETMLSSEVTDLVTSDPISNQFNGQHACLQDPCPQIHVTNAIETEGGWSPDTAINKEQLTFFGFF